MAFFIQAPRRNPVDRLTEALLWTERELKLRTMDHAGTRFRFCALDPATTTPEELLLGANWYTPFDSTPQTLINLSVSTEGGV